MSFLLHHELIAEGEPSAWMFFLHGIYGQGRNWRSIGRKLSRRRPDWGFVLVDLRQHGRSQGAPPPHTLESAAKDLEDLAQRLGSEQKPVRAVCGHSFGGKVALRYRGLAGPELLQSWVLDASPSAQPGAMDEDGTVVSVLRTLEALPQRWESREAFVSEVTGRGFAKGVAMWLAMNLEAKEGGAYESRLDLAAIRELLGDYYARDLWQCVEDPGAPGEVRFVVAGRSSALSPEDVSRLGLLAAEREEVKVQELPEVGHWLHVEVPDQVAALLGDALPSIAA